MAINLINKLKTYKAKLIVTGCLSGINKGLLDSAFTGLSFTPFNMGFLDSIFPDFTIKFADVPDAYKAPFFNFRFLIGRRLIHWNLLLIWNARAYIRDKLSKAFYLRVCSGCIETHCSYCVIWSGIGKLKSRPIDDCLRGLSFALSKGYRKIIFIGDNLGAYGLDLNLTFTDLLCEVLKLKGKYSLQLEELHPIWIIKYLDKIVPIMKSGKIRIISCPIQSGSDRILRLMNRQHDSMQIKLALFELKKHNPKLRLYTYIMIGFPSESNQDFSDTLQLVKDVGFEYVNIMLYEPMLDSSSYNFNGRIPNKVIVERAKLAASFFTRNRISYFVAHY
jgi:tRNA A37 methylthiotransferase MiaB